ncbi:hypothetical protein PoB_004421500 [Plakobranchus ocellatus]|uniref:Uncharacterized protein n=1 Tax=Plakobranchus ocellatus TaxID=259542 RepID=A0AAV4BAR8_9GAST|nr:hypothetical protein PoB_004421500 [Plakobranchus ocellatus]
MNGDNITLFNGSADNISFAFGTGKLFTEINETAKNNSEEEARLNTLLESHQSITNSDEILSLTNKTAISPIMRVEGRRELTVGTKTLGNETLPSATSQLSQNTFTGKPDDLSSTSPFSETREAVKTADFREIGINASFGVDDLLRNKHDLPRENKGLNVANSRNNTGHGSGLHQSVSNTTLHQNGSSLPSVVDNLEQVKSNSDIMRRHSLEGSINHMSLSHAQGSVSDIREDYIKDITSNTGFDRPQVTNRNSVNSLGRASITSAASSGDPYRSDKTQSILEGRLGVNSPNISQSSEQVMLNHLLGNHIVNARNIPQNSKQTELRENMGVDIINDKTMPQSFISLQGDLRDNLGDHIVDVQDVPQNSDKVVFKGTQNNGMNSLHTVDNPIIYGNDPPRINSAIKETYPLLENPIGGMLLNLPNTAQTIGEPVQGGKEINDHNFNINSRYSSSPLNGNRNNDNKNIYDKNGNNMSFGETSVNNLQQNLSYRSAYINDLNTNILSNQNSPTVNTNQSQNRNNLTNNNRNFYQGSEFVPLQKFNSNKTPQGGLSPAFPQDGSHIHSDFTQVNGHAFSTSFGHGKPPIATIPREDAAQHTFSGSSDQRNTLALRESLNAANQNQLTGTNNLHLPSLNILKETANGNSFDPIHTQQNIEAPNNSKVIRQQTETQLLNSQTSLLNPIQTVFKDQQKASAPLLLGEMSRFSTTRYPQSVTSGNTQLDLCKPSYRCSHASQRQNTLRFPFPTAQMTSASFTAKPIISLQFEQAGGSTNGRNAKGSFYSTSKGTENFSAGHVDKLNGLNNENTFLNPNAALGVSNIHKGLNFGQKSVDFTSNNNPSHHYLSQPDNINNYDYRNLNNNNNNPVDSKILQSTFNNVQNRDIRGNVYPYYRENSEHKDLLFSVGNIRQKLLNGTDSNNMNIRKAESYNMEKNLKKNTPSVFNVNVGESTGNRVNSINPYNRQQNNPLNTISYRDLYITHKELDGPPVPVLRSSSLPPQTNIWGANDQTLSKTGNILGQEQFQMNYVSTLAPLLGLRVENQPLSQLQYGQNNNRATQFSDFLRPHINARQTQGPNSTVFNPTSSYVRPQNTGSVTTWQNQQESQNTQGFDNSGEVKVPPIYHFNNPILEQPLSQAESHLPSSDPNIRPNSPTFEQRRSLWQQPVQQNSLLHKNIYGTNQTSLLQFSTLDSRPTNVQKEVPQQGYIFQSGPNLSRQSWSLPQQSHDIARQNSKTYHKMNDGLPRVPATDFTTQDLSKFSSLARNHLTRDSLPQGRIQQDLVQPRFGYGINGISHGANNPNPPLHHSQTGQSFKTQTNKRSQTELNTQQNLLSQARPQPFLRPPLQEPVSAITNNWQGSSQTLSNNDIGKDPNLSKGQTLFINSPNNKIANQMHSSQGTVFSSNLRQPGQQVVPNSSPLQLGVKWGQTSLSPKGQDLPHKSMNSNTVSRTITPEGLGRSSQADVGRIANTSSILGKSSLSISTDETHKRTVDRLWPEQNTNFRSAGRRHLAEDSKISTGNNRQPLLSNPQTVTNDMSLKPPKGQNINRIDTHRERNVQLSNALGDQGHVVPQDFPVTYWQQEFPNPTRSNAYVNFNPAQNSPYYQSNAYDVYSSIPVSSYYQSFYGASPSYLRTSYFPHGVVTNNNGLRQLA